MITLLLETKFEQQILANPKAKDILRVFDNHLKYDQNLPVKIMLEIGSKPKPEHALSVWTKHVSNAIKNSFYNNHNEGLKYLPYLFKFYTRGVLDWEDLTGEAIDNIRKWWLIKNTGQLNPKHQDLNSMSPTYLGRILRKESYQDILRKLQDAETLEKAKRNRQEIVLINNDKYFVSIPLNYGACYVFNNAEGIQANFCTGGSSGMSWFGRYAPQGPLLMVVDKQKVNEKDGKWQIHANTNQIVNSQQDRRWDKEGNSKKFAIWFPGLMTEITQAMLDKKEEIKAMSKAALDTSYDVDAAVAELKKTFPNTFLTPDQLGNELEL